LVTLKDKPSYISETVFIDKVDDIFKITPYTLFHLHTQNIGIKTKGWFLLRYRKTFLKFTVEFEDDYDVMRFPVYSERWS